MRVNLIEVLGVWVLKMRIPKATAAGKLERTPDPELSMYFAVCEHTTVV